MFNDKAGMCKYRHMYTHTRAHTLICKFTKFADFYFPVYKYSHYDRSQTTKYRTEKRRTDLALTGQCLPAPVHQKASPQFLKLKNTRQHKSSEKPEMNRDIGFTCGFELSREKKTSASSEIVQNTGRTTEAESETKETAKRKKVKLLWNSILIT